MSGHFRVSNIFLLLTKFYYKSQLFTSLTTYLISILLNFIILANIKKCVLNTLRV